MQNGATTLSIMTLTTTTFSITKNVTLSIMTHSIFMLNVAYAQCHSCWVSHASPLWWMSLYCLSLYWVSWCLQNRLMLPKGSFTVTEFVGKSVRGIMPWLHHPYSPWSLLSLAWTNRNDPNCVVKPWVGQWNSAYYTPMKENSYLKLPQMSY
jgi:hypothetical protein